MVSICSLSGLFLRIRRKKQGGSAQARGGRSGRSDNGGLRSCLHNVLYFVALEAISSMGALIEPDGIVYKSSNLNYIVMKKSGLVSKLKAAGLAAAISVLPAEEVDSGVSYGGNIGIGFNGDISVAGQVLTSNKAKTMVGKFGLHFLLTGKDRGEIGASVGAGYLFPRGITSTIEGRYNPKSENPLSLGFGLGYGNIEKNEENGINEELGDICAYRVSEGGFVNRGGLCEKRCEDTGGTWVNGSCECPETLYIDGTCGYTN